VLEARLRYGYFGADRVGDQTLTKPAPPASLQEWVYEASAIQGQSDLSPHPGHPWEDLAVFNPAAWYDEKAKEVLLLYRAAESGPEYKCYFGLAGSKDGYHFERASDEPALGRASRASTVRRSRTLE